MKVDWRYVPSTELGGDAFGYNWVDSEHFAIYLLDVCGHGVGASLLSVSVINMIRTGTLSGVDFRDPGAVLTSLNEAFPMEKQNDMYFTMWYGVYHVPSRTLKHAAVVTRLRCWLLVKEKGSMSRVRCPGPLVGVIQGRSMRLNRSTYPREANYTFIVTGCSKFVTRVTGGWLNMRILWTAFAPSQGIPIV